MRKQTRDFLDKKERVLEIVSKNRNDLGIFQDMLFRHQQKYKKDVSHEKVMNDYQSFYRFSDNIYSSSAQSGDNTRPTFQELEMAAFERSGIGRYITFHFGTACVKNGFDFFDWEGNYVRKKNIKKDLFKAKFNTEHLHWVVYELIYGISFLVKYWSSHDKYDTPPPRNRPPLAYKAMPPTLLSPANITDTKMLWEDEDAWDFYGGKYNSFKIHRDRVEILCTRPNPNSWIGFSIIEPVYLSYAGYLNLIINGVKAVAKYGNVVAAFTMAYPNPSKQMYLEYKELVESMKASMTFILGKEESIEFLDTKIGQGLAELGEFLKEDIMAGTGLALNNVFGRSEGGGLQGAGALLADQHELNTKANYQADLADNYWAMMDKHWDVEDLLVRFRLEQQKTDRARYEEELLQWQIEALKAQVEATKLQNLLTAMQGQMAAENPQMTPTGGAVPNQTGGLPANQTGVPGNGGKQQLENKNSPQQSTLSLQKIKKANQDFIANNYKILRNFNPRIIDIEFRDDNE